MDEEQDLIRFFTKSPNFLFYGLPSLSIQDKWALLALMSMCWDRRKAGVTLKELEGPYKLSLREIATITGVKHTILRSKEGKDPREGVLNRLAALGYVTIVDARPKSEITGKPGRLQTYLYIHLEKIWADNALFFETWNAPLNRLVSKNSFEIDPSTVNVVNSDVNHGNNNVNEDNNEVNHVNDNVNLANNDVNQNNNEVAVVNSDVNAASSNSGLIQNKTTNTFEEREKDSVVPTSAQELPTLSQPETSSPSLSQKNISSFSSSAEEIKPTKEAKPTPVDYALFDRLCRSKGYATDFRVPRDEKNNAAIKKLREQGANAEQVEFVFNDIWDDKDPFWQQHRGNPSTVASQFTARVWKMTAPAQKRRTASGLPNWTEDKTMGVPAIVEPTVSTSTPEPTIMPTPKPTVASAPAKPKEITLPRDYSRLPQQRVVRPRTAWGRRQQAEKEAQEKVMK